jgi:hypothetical protein
MFIQEIGIFSISLLQSTVEGILGSEGPAEDDSEAREEAETV